MSRCLTLIALLLTLFASAHAQRTDTILRNPNAVQLRRIWMMAGEHTDQLGYTGGPLFDIDGDGRDEWCVGSVGAQKLWVIGYDSVAGTYVEKQSFPSTLYIQPVTGDFRGDGRRSMVFLRTTGTTPTGGREISGYLYDTLAGRFGDTPSMMWSSRLADSSGDIYLTVSAMLAADLDRDGDDELLLFGEGALRNGRYLRHGEIWIYEGGPGFQLDTPALILRDSIDCEYRFQPQVGDIDGDGYPDILVSGNFSPPPHNHVYWGARDLHTIGPGYGFLGRLDWIKLMKLDADSAADIVYDHTIFLSDRRKNARTRSFDSVTDADLELPHFGQIAFNVGPINDSSRRFDMYGLTGTGPGGVELLCFSGGESGPDNAYEAYYSSGLDGFGNGDAFGDNTGPAGDVDGDGWVDVFTANSLFPSFADQNGVALILAGGPYIPRDTLVPSAIREIELESHAAAISVWPNPARDYINIACRGDLRHMPAGVRLIDLLGREVGRAAIIAGAATIALNELPAGQYILIVLDDHGIPVTSATMVHLR